MKSIILVLLCVIMAALPACSGKEDAPAIGGSIGENDTVYSTDWGSATFGIKAAEDIAALHALMSERGQPVLEPADVESITGIRGSASRYEGVETQKDLADYEYSDGIRLTAAFFENVTYFFLYIHDERVFRDASIIAPDISVLGLGSTYEDYVRVIGAKGVLTGIVGSHDLTFTWVNSEGHKLEAVFYASSGCVLSSYNYW